MRLSLAVFCIASLASQVHAQTGPSDARVLGSTFRGAGPSSMQYWAMLEFTVRSDGTLTDPRIVESSGSQSFDAEALRTTPESLRVRPAITADGKIRDDATVRMAYGNSLKRIAPPARPEKETPVRTEGERTADEGQRILRMRCQDFLWEYDFMVGLKARVMDEEMPRTSVAVYRAVKQLPEKAMKKLWRVAPAAIKGAADECRVQPAANFVKDVLVPAFDSRLR